MLTSVPPGLQQKGSDKILPLILLFVICVHLKYTGNCCHCITKTDANHFIFWIFFIVAQICELFSGFFSPLIFLFLSFLVIFFSPRLFFFQMNRCVRIMFMSWYVLNYPQNSVLCYCRTHRLVTPNRLMNMCVYRRYQEASSFLPTAMLQFCCFFCVLLSFVSWFSDQVLGHPPARAHSFHFPSSAQKILSIFNEDLVFFCFLAALRESQVVCCSPRSV